MKLYFHLIVRQLFLSYFVVDCSGNILVVMVNVIVPEKDLHIQNNGADLKWHGASSFRPPLWPNRVNDC